MEALNKANDIRITRCNKKREIAAYPTHEGRAMLANLLADCPTYIWTERVERFLRWPARSGEEFARRTLLKAKVSPHRTIGSLTMREKARIAEELR